MFCGADGFARCYPKERLTTVNTVVVGQTGQLVWMVINPQAARIHHLKISFHVKSFMDWKTLLQI